MSELDHGRKVDEDLLQHEYLEAVYQLNLAKAALMRLHTVMGPHAADLAACDEVIRARLVLHDRLNAAGVGVPRSWAVWAERDRALLAEAIPAFIETTLPAKATGKATRIPAVRHTAHRHLRPGRCRP